MSRISILPASGGTTSEDRSLALSDCPLSWTGNLATSFVLVIQSPCPCTPFHRGDRARSEQLYSRKSQHGQAYLGDQNVHQKRIPLSILALVTRLGACSPTSNSRIPGPRIHPEVYPMNPRVFVGAHLPSPIPSQWMDTCLSITASRSKRWRRPV